MRTMSDLQPIEGENNKSALLEASKFVVIYPSCIGKVIHMLYAKLDFTEREKIIIL